MEFEDAVGALAVKLAREAVTKHLHHEQFDVKTVPEQFHMKSGVFTTIYTYPSRDLRGCIGFPEPVYELIKALISSAIYAATEDPRFYPISIDELDKVIFEVSLLTPPEKIIVKDPEEYPSLIKIGEHGLIATKNNRSGLLLPQVPVEYRWDVKTFLAQTCIKAGLSPNDWKDENCTIYKFSAEIFEELEPHGKIIRKTL